MQTVNFNCSFCGKPMAVGMNLLGRNVRCPHCKQVVQAPATGKPTEKAPPPVPAPSLPPAQATISPVAEGQESIFGEAPDNDDLFSGKAPPMNLPPFDPAPGYTPPRTESAIGQTERVVPGTPFSSAGFTANRDKDQDYPANSGGIDSVLTSDNDELDNRAERRPIPRSAPRHGGGGMFVWMLLLYAVIATGIAAYLFYDKTRLEAQQEAGGGDGKPSPYLAIPDFFGEYDRAKRERAAKLEGMPADNLPIPDALKVKLNDTRQVGDLAVTPLRVECKVVNRFRRGDGKPDEFFRVTPGKVYALHLRLKNNSSDVAFHPTDPAFNRHRRSKPEGLPIYTGIVVEKDFQMGGGIPWPDATREYLDGQQNDISPLAPGEEREYVIVSHYDFPILRRKIDESKDPNVTWRVQLRRGLETVKDSAGVDRDISVSSVIGVEFDRGEILY